MYLVSPSSNTGLMQRDGYELYPTRAAGMHTIAVTNSYDAEQLSPAERIVASLSELTIDDLHQLCT